MSYTNVRSVYNILPPDTQFIQDNVISFSDNLAGGTTVNLTSQSSLYDESYVLINGNNDYVGEYTIFNVTATSFDIPVLFTSSNTGISIDVTVLKSLLDQASSLVVQMINNGCLKNKPDVILKNIEIWYTAYLWTLIDTNSGVSVTEKELKDQYRVKFNRSQENAYLKAANQFSGGCIGKIDSENIIPLITSVPLQSILDDCVNC